MNTHTEYFLACVVEECAEVQKEIMKAFRFGLSDSNPKGDGSTNTQNIERELVDLEAAIDMLRRNVVLFDDVRDEDKYNIKQRKILKWKEYADEVWK